MLQYIGYHLMQNLPIKKDQIVTILKRTKIKYRGQIKEAKRTYKIKVDHVLPGQSYSKFHITGNDRGKLKMTEEEIKNYPGDFIPVRNPSIRWPSVGGYWAEVDINDIPEAKN